MGQRPFKDIGAYQLMTSFSFLTRTHRRGALACALLAIAGPAAAFQVQETNTVGPAEIRDFSLPGTRPQRPEPEPTIAPLAPPLAQPVAPVVTPTPAPAQPAPTPAPTPAQARPTTAAPASARVVARPTPTALPATTPTAATDTPVVEPVATPVETPLPSETPIDGPIGTEPATAPDDGMPWLYLVLGAAVSALALFAFLKLRSRGSQAARERFPIATPEPAPRPEPVARAQKPAAPIVPPPVPAPPAPANEVVGIVMRPWLELEFRPERATATADGAGVQYEVTIRNVGNAPARNVRLAAQMFNAGPELDREVAGFFARGVDDRGAAPMTILPRTEVKLQSTVGMARADMREIKVQGRSLFIPTVAFNLLYAWGRDKTGQTCSSHIVGREPEQASEKMAPFRLDLGPRVYRSVGQRPSSLARAV